MPGGRGEVGIIMTGLGYWLEPPYVRRSELHSTHHVRITFLVVLIKISITNVSTCMLIKPLFSWWNGHNYKKPCCYKERNIVKLLHCFSLNCYLPKFQNSLWLKRHTVHSFWNLGLQIGMQLLQGLCLKDTSNTLFQ